MYIICIKMTTKMSRTVFSVIYVGSASKTHRKQNLDTLELRHIRTLKKLWHCKEVELRGIKIIFPASITQECKYITCFKYQK